MKERLKIAAMLFIISGCAYSIYWQSDLRKLQVLDAYYREVNHPSWSQRILLVKESCPSGGSGDQNILYLVDIRRVAISTEDAKSFYREEGDRLALREFRIDSGTELRAEAEEDRVWWTYSKLNLNIPVGEDILVLGQIVSSDSTWLRNPDG